MYARVLRMCVFVIQVAQPEFHGYPAASGVPVKNTGLMRYQYCTGVDFIPVCNSRDGGDGGSFVWCMSVVYHVCMLLRVQLFLFMFACLCSGASTTFVRSVH